MGIGVGVHLDDLLHTAWRRRTSPAGASGFAEFGVITCFDALKLHVGFNALPIRHYERRGKLTAIADQDNFNLATAFNESSETVSSGFRCRRYET